MIRRIFCSSAEGAFDGLEKIVEQRLNAGSIGFNAPIVDKNELDIDALLHQVLPQDLTKFGLIPEFIGRVPVTVSLNMLDKNTLVQILSKPKNALTKQYQKLFELDDVKLEFTDDALMASGGTGGRAENRRQRTPVHSGEGDERADV